MSSERCGKSRLLDLIGRKSRPAWDDCCRGSHRAAAAEWQVTQAGADFVSIVVVIQAEPRDPHNAVNSCNGVHQVIELGGAADLQFKVR